MRLLNFAVLAALFSLSLLPGPAFAENELTKSDSPQLVIKAPLSETQEAVITASELNDATPEQIAEILKDPRVQNSDLIVSTDQEKVIENVINATSGENDTRKVRFIPLGKLASAKQKMASGFSAYYQRAKHTLMHDRIGLTVLTITVGYDTLIWIHSTSIDIHQKTSMVMMNIVMAATFGLDRDLWTKMTGPLKNKLITVFDRFLVNDRFASLKIITSTYLSNIVFGIGVQTARMGLLSLDHLSSAVMTTDFWLTAAKVGALVTSTAFAWTEMYGAIEMQKNPVAKLMMKRVGEMRGIILSQLASISMVLQPGVYGHVPLVTFVVHGTLGLIVLMNADKIMEYLEASPLINRVYKKVQTFEHFINEGLQFNSKAKGRVVRTCESLFAN